MKEEINGLDKDAAPILSSDDQIVNWIALKSIIGTDLNEKHRRFTTDRFQNSFLYRGICSATPAVDPLSGALNAWKSAKIPIDFLVCRLSACDLSHTQIRANNAPRVVLSPARQPSPRPSSEWRRRRMPRKR